MSDFSEISSRYEKDSLVQRSASEELFELVRIQPSENVLDIGCGTGNLTVKAVEQTKGRVAGIDASEGMIDEAVRNYSSLGIEFQVSSVDQMTFENSFDVIFCNSTFQWFKNPRPALEACLRALKPGGRMGIQAPARERYSPNFVDAVEAAVAEGGLGELYSSFQSPWCFKETPEEYTSLFESAGFEVIHSRIDEVVTSHTPEEVFTIFDSGAAAGFLDPEYYRLHITDDYISALRKGIRGAFKAQANPDGRVDLVFYRIYLLARKPADS